MIVAGASILATILVILAVFYAMGTGARVAAAPKPAATSAADAKLAALARGYLAIARPADDQLNAEEDGYAASEDGNLAAARSDLRKEVATERRFDQQLATIKFPASIEAIAQALIRANQSRFHVTERQARSAAIARLRSLDARRKAGDAAVEVQVRLLRTALHLPPPSTS